MISIKLDLTYNPNIQFFRIRQVNIDERVRLPSSTSCKRTIQVEENIMGDAYPHFVFYDRGNYRRPPLQLASPIIRFSPYDIRRSGAWTEHDSHLFGNPAA